MILSKENAGKIAAQPWLDIPGANIFSLPEKVLQFGTGVLLRGLPDYFIDKANKKGIFNGRIVVVKSTSQGGTDAFGKQDNCFTQCVRGIDNGQTVDQAVINASISRVLSAADQWKEVLACAANPELRVVISNTTEVGITLLPGDNVNAQPPVSFPGKLLAFLQERHRVFNGSAESGLVIIPTELIPGNGDKLKGIVLELAEQNKLDKRLIEWITMANDFCNSLVDRIVPGMLPGEDKAAMESRLGYKDDLIIMSEVYRLWAIETSSARTREILSFAQADEGVVIAADIDRFRELKLRLLNGSHTFTCALAIQMGFTTVKEAMENEVFGHFISQLMYSEIVPAIESEKVSAEAARQFATQVLDRYRNPYIEHNWLSISLQYTSKMKMRNVPVLQSYFSRKGRVPEHMALGFAAYLLFMKSEKSGDHVYTGHSAGKKYTINDDKAGRICELWHNADTDTFAKQVLEDTDLWGANLNELPGFRDAVSANIKALVVGKPQEIVAALDTAPAK